MDRKAWIILISTCFSSGIYTAHAQQQLRYTYDALGRLTFVEDNVNGNRDYGYDPAGNRVSVTVGSSANGADGSPPAMLDTPTASSCSQIASGSPGPHQARWTSASDPAYFLIRAEPSTVQFIRVSGTTRSYVFSNAVCKWVMACNVDDVCTNKAYF